MATTDKKLFPAWEAMDKVESMSERELDELPFGAIQLDANGKILRYNHTGSSTASVGLANGDRMARDRMARDRLARDRLARGDGRKFPMSPSASPKHVAQARRPSTSIEKLNAR